MAVITEVTRFSVDGELFDTLDKADAYLLDRFGEEMDEVMRTVCPELRYSRYMVPIITAMWEKRSMFRDLLDVQQNLMERYDGDDT